MEKKFKDLLVREAIKEVLYIAVALILVGALQIAVIAYVNHITIKRGFEKYFYTDEYKENMESISSGLKKLIQMTEELRKSKKESKEKIAQELKRTIE